MKALKLALLTFGTLALVLPKGHCQGFSSGSDGSYGAINVTVTTNLSMPANGIFNCTTITVASGSTLGFLRNPLNTPVFLLATGDVTLSGNVDVSGQNPGGSPPIGGAGGPGGFDGGLPGQDPSQIPPGAGLGPGAGNGGVPSSSVANGAGAGGYGAVGSGGSSTNHGGIYGSPLLVPMVGGSGGGGTTGSPGIGGGGGGGAILIASSTKIIVNGTILSRGGFGGGGAFNGGSGGAIRLVAPVIAGSGSAQVYGNTGGGAGRIRIDTLDRTGMNIGVNPSTAASVGAAMFLFPSPLPRLDVIQAAGTAIPVGAAGPVTVVLPFGSSTNQTITVQAKDFSGVVPINVVLTPENGVPTTYPAQIDLTSANPASTTVNAVFPINVRTIVNAWTR